MLVALKPGYGLSLALQLKHEVPYCSALPRPWTSLARHSARRSSARAGQACSCLHVELSSYRPLGMIITCYESNSFVYSRTSGPERLEAGES